MHDAWCAANLASEAMVVPVSMPAQSTREFFEAARAQPGKITFGSGGNGSPAHLLA